MLRKHGQGAAIISGKEFGDLLNRTSNNWKEKDLSFTSELEPTLTIYISNRVKHAISFYESEPELAMILYDDNYKYYTIPKETYEQLNMMYSLRSYIIAEEVMDAVTGGKSTNNQSIQDSPVGVDYKILKVGNSGYYIYERKGKYYCESPYVFINEISEGVYKSALKFALNPEEMSSNISPPNTDLPDFAYSGSDPIERLVYNTEIEKYKSGNGEFTITASHIFGSHEEGNKLKMESRLMDFLIKFSLIIVITKI